MEASWENAKLLLETMLINQVEATKHRMAMEDQELRALLTYFWERIILSENRPKGAFDVLFFTKLMEEIFREKDALRHILERKVYRHPMDFSEEESDECL